MRVLSIVFVLLLMATPSHAREVGAVVGSDTTYTTVEGDNVLKVARRFRLAPDHLAWANGLEIASKLEPGWELFIPRRRIPPLSPPRDGIVVNVPERVLYLYRGGRLADWYPVGVGNPLYPTPMGTYRIKERIRFPTYYPPDRGVKPIPPGPDNPLGDRWMGTTAGNVGIHGTDDPWSIGDSASGGCIRMYPELIRELFDRVSVGTLVRFEYHTVRVARDETGRLHALSWPDVYYAMPIDAEARRLSRACGLTALAVTDTLTGARVGCPTPIGGPARALRVDGTPIGFSASSDTDGTWIPAAALERIGLAVSSDVSTRTVTVRRDSQSVTLPLRFRGRVAGAAVMEKGELLVPLEATLQPFAIRWRWTTDGLEIASGR